VAEPAESLHFGSSRLSVGSSIDWPQIERREAEATVKSAS
jgi:hypothetical protein